MFDTPTAPLNIALVGATGNIGSRLLTEALDRGHAVTGIARNVQRLPAHPSLRAAKSQPDVPGNMASLMAGHDLVIYSVKWVDNDIEEAIEAVRDSGVKRVIFIVGAGSLLMPDGRTWYEHNAARGTAPPTSRPGVLAYEEIRRITDLAWTAVSPAAVIQPGKRTTRYRLGLDHLLMDEKGDSLISLEDFAVAVLDEAERPRHLNKRFTLAY